MKKILVTGGCGFIGTNLVSYLLDHTNWHINVLDNLSEGRFEYLTSLDSYDSERVYFKEGDVRDDLDVSVMIEGCDYVAHLAAQTDVISSINDPFTDADVNIMGTLTVLEAALREGVRSFSFSSSAAPLGEKSPPIDEKNVPSPLSPYGASKLSCEGYCSAYAGSHGLSTTALRFSNVYGPNSWHKGSVIAKFIKTILDGKRPVIFGDGDQSRDFIHAYDISWGIHQSLVIDFSNAYNLFQLGTGNETTINQLYNMIDHELESIGIEVPEPKYASARAGEIYRNYCNISHAKRELKFNPRYDLETGLSDTIKWFLEKYES